MDTMRSYQNKAILKVLSQTESHLLHIQQYNNINMSYIISYF